MAVALKHRDPKYRKKKTPLNFDLAHVANVLCEKGLDPFGKLADLIDHPDIDSDLRLKALVLQYLGDHVKAKPKQLEVNGTLKVGLAEVLAGLSAHKNS